VGTRFAARKSTNALAWERDDGSTAMTRKGAGAICVIVEHGEEYAVTRLPAYGEVWQVGGTQASLRFKRSCHRCPG
jgi:hypothetical protein